MDNAHSRDRNRGSVAYLGLAATLLVASGGLLGGYYMDRAPGSGAAGQAVPEDADDPRGVEPAVVEAAASEFLAGQVELRIGDHSVSRTFAALGLGIDADGVERAARGADPDHVLASLRASGGLPVTVDRDRAMAELEELKAAYDQPPRDARMDLEARVIHESKDGVSLDIFGSLGVLEVAARSGAGQVELSTVAFPAEVTVESLGIDDISHVLASFETKYSVSDHERNFNLKLAASKLNGYVLQPGAEFSFNEVVGDRTEKEGYKIAHVITAGEMVDGLAGGTCQISTTLHGAAFFAGIGIEKALPHSRPSTYVTMGLDATVVYPHVDVKLKNDYDFPVVIHYKVAHGTTRVEILGKERPYDEIVYEREVVEKLEFDTVTREDERMPVGTMQVDQFGFFGFKVKKIRKYYKDGKLVKRDNWNLRYAPVTEYVRTGSNPDPNLAPPKASKHSRLKEPDIGTFRMSQ